MSRKQSNGVPSHSPSPAPSDSRRGSLGDCPATRVHGDCGRPPSGRDGALLRPVSRLPSWASCEGPRPNKPLVSRTRSESPRPQVVDDLAETHVPSAPSAGPGASRRMHSAGRQREEPSRPSSQAAGDDAASSADSSSMDSEDEIEDLPGDHAWQFAYDRRLTDFSKAVSSLAFSGDGRWLVGSSGAADPKVWDARSWAAVGTLNSSKKEKVRTLCASPDGSWLATVQPSSLNVFVSENPWRLAFSQAPETVEGSEWCCATICATSTRIAAMSTTHLCIVDCNNGWHADAPQRAHSLLRYARPTCIQFHPCGVSVICGFEDGQLLVWSSSELSLDHTLDAHDGVLHCIGTSPDRAEYPTRFVSCGADDVLSVWNGSTWAREQRIHDTKCGRTGIVNCAFSSSGEWLISAAEVLCVWRVCCTPRGRIALRIHQRVKPVGGCEGLRAVAFCASSDAVVAGSGDGALGLWVKVAEAPARPATPLEVNHKKPKKQSPVDDLVLPRPMNKVAPQRPAESPVPSPPPPRTWNQQAQLRPADMPLRDVAAADGKSAHLADIRKDSLQLPRSDHQRTALERRRCATASPAPACRMPGLRQQYTPPRPERQNGRDLLRTGCGFPASRGRTHAAIDKMGSSSLATAKLNLSTTAPRPTMASSMVKPMLLPQREPATKRWDPNRFSSVAASLNDMSNTRGVGGTQRFSSPHRQGSHEAIAECPKVARATTAAASMRTASLSRMPQKDQSQNFAQGDYRSRSCAVLREQGSRVLCA